MSKLAATDSYNCLWFRLFNIVFN